MATYPRFVAQKDRPNLTKVSIERQLAFLLQAVEESGSGSGFGEGSGEVGIKENLLMEDDDDGGGEASADLSSNYGTRRALMARQPGTLRSVQGIKAFEKYSCGATSTSTLSSASNPAPPKIFVYDALYHGGELHCHHGQYGTETLYANFLRQSACRTHN